MNMKTITKIFGTALLAFAAAALYSCNDEIAYTPGEVVDGPQVYFSPESPSTVDLSTTESSFDVTVLRATSDDAVSVNLNVTDGSNGLFDIPTVVSFAAGQTSATLTIGYEYNEDDFPYDTYYDVTISIPDDCSTPYGLGSYSFTAGVPGPWTSIGTCTYADAFFFDDAYSAEIFQNGVNPNQFRIEYPYADGLVKEGYVDDGDQWGGDQYLTFTIMSPGNVLNSTTITMDDLVFWDAFDTGWNNPSYDANVKLYHPAAFSGYQDESYWVNSCVLSYQESGLPAQVQLAPFYYMDGVGGWNYSSYSGMVVITFPGAVIKDYSVEVAYAGKYSDADDNYQIVGSVTLGEDVESAEVALVAGSVSVSSTAEAVELIEQAGNGQSVSASGTVSFDCNDSGTYTLVAVSYDADDEAQEYSCASFKFSIVTETWHEYGTGDYIYTLYFGDEDDPYTDAGLTLWQSDTDASHFKISDWGYGVDFCFSWDQTTNDVYVEDNYTGYNSSSYGPIYVDEIDDWNGGFSYQSYYEGGTFYFCVVYYCSAGYFGYGYESFILNGVPTSVSNFVGNYDVSETSYFYGKYSGTYEWKFEESDDPDSGNIMLTVFDDIECYEPIYGDLDEQTGKFVLYDGQYFYEYADEDFGTISLWFTVNSSDDDFATFRVTEDGFEGAQDNLFGEYAIAEDWGFDLGWYDAFESVTGTRSSASSNSVKQNSVRDTKSIQKMSKDFDSSKALPQLAGTKVSKSAVSRQSANSKADKKKLDMTSEPFYK